MENKKLLLNWLDNLVIYERDYDILNRLLETNNKFLIRALIEIAKGNLLISDFETILGGPSFDKYLEEKLILNKKIEEDLNLILSANDALTSHNPELNKVIYENLIVSSDEEDLIQEITDDELYSFFKQTPESNLLFRQHKEKLLEYFNEGVIDKNFLNTYIRIPVIPINYNDVVLNEEDKRYALGKKISLEEMKKIKSLSLYYRGRGK